MRPAASVCCYRCGIAAGGGTTLILFSDGAYNKLHSNGAFRTAVVPTTVMSALDLNNDAKVRGLGGHSGQPVHQGYGHGSEPHGPLRT